jgi:hypothetical protein
VVPGLHKLWNRRPFQSLRCPPSFPPSLPQCVRGGAIGLRLVSACSFEVFFGCWRYVSAPVQGYTRTCMCVRWLNVSASVVASAGCRAKARTLKFYISLLLSLSRARSLSLSLALSLSGCNRERPGDLQDSRQRSHAFEGSGFSERGRQVRSTAHGAGARCARRMVVAALL